MFHKYMYLVTAPLLATVEETRPQGLQKLSSLKSRKNQKLQPIPGIFTLPTIRYGFLKKNLGGKFVKTSKLIHKQRRYGRDS